MDWLKYEIDYGILGFLAILSFIALSIVVERYLVFRTVDIADFEDSRSLEMELTRKLHIIATIGSNAPYIGLLGTVLGSMLTFYTMGRSGFMDSYEIMIGLALALKATAAGIGLAIPSVAAYNFLLRRVKVLIMQWEIRNGRERIRLH